MFPLIFPTAIGKLEIYHRKILSFFSPIKKDFIFPDSGSQAQEDNPNVPDPESGNLSKKIAIS